MAMAWFSVCAMFDHILWQPGLWLLVALSIVAAGICVLNLRERGLRLPIAAAVVVFGPAIILNLMQPIIEQLWVRPDQLRVETPYLIRNIGMTRRAYQLDTFDVKPIEGSGTSRRPLLQRIPRPSRTFGCRTSPVPHHIPPSTNISLYDDFTSLDIDRYWWDSNENEVMLSARELNVSLLPSEAQTSIDRHLQVYPRLRIGNESGQRQRPARLAGPLYQDIPPQSSLNLEDHQAWYLLRPGTRHLRAGQGAHTRTRLSTQAATMFSA